MDAHDTCVAIATLLRNRGWHEDKTSHFRLYNTDDGKTGELVVDTAVEVGYVYNETTVRFNQLGGQSGSVDTGTYDRMHGMGPEFVARVNEAIKNLESMANRDDLDEDREPIK